MRTPLPAILYSAAVLIAGVAAWGGSHLITQAIGVGSVGSIILAALGAVYVGELKQESIGQLYQALASSALKSSEQAAVNESALRKVQQIRRILFWSNLAKFAGAVPAIILFNDKPAAESLKAIWCCQIGIFLLLISGLYFVRLWFEVSSAERLLIETKYATLVHQRREAFLAGSEAALPHDFESDDASHSYSQAATRLAASALK